MRAWRAVALPALAPALFLALLLVLPLASFFAYAGATGELSPWARARLGASLRLGLATTGLALLVGLPLAYLLGRHRFPGRRALRAVVTVPFVMPVVVVAAGLLALLGPRGLVARATGFDPGLDGTFALLLVAHTIYNVPLVVRLVGDTWAHLDPRLEDAAATLGAGPARRFVWVTLPRLAPALAAASLLAFLFGFTGFGTVLLLADPVEHATIEVGIYHLGIRLFDLHAAATLALVQLVVTALAALAYAFLVERAAASHAAVDETTALRPLSRASRPLVALAAATAALLVLPLVAVVVLAFRTPEGWGLGAFARLGDASSALAIGPARAALNSVRFALLTVLFALPLGLLAARAAAKARRGAALDALWMLPLGASAVTLGLGLLLAFPWSVHPPYPAWWPDGARLALELDLRATAWLLVAAHVLLAFPFVVRALVGPLRAHDASLDEAARTLGATRTQRALRVHLPVLGPALVVAAVLAASVSLGEFGATLVVQRPETATLPVEMVRTLSSTRPDPWLAPTAMAMATLLLVVDLAAFLAIERLRPGRSGGF